MLIFLLDMTTVVYITGLFISENFNSINFARKEILGTTYSEVIRQNVMDRLLDTPSSQSKHTLAAKRSELDAVLFSESQSTRFQKALDALDTPPAPSTSVRPTSELLAAARALLTSIGNQSNLILDPDLDSYYVMSIVMLRLPDLLEGLHAGLALDLVNATTQQKTSEIVLVTGRLETLRQNLEEDYLQAIAAGDQALLRSLQPQHQALLDAMDVYLSVLKQAAQIGTAGQTTSTQVQLLDAYKQAIHALNDQWQQGFIQLERLLSLRIENLYKRMALHLSTAMLLLLTILSLVYLVASQISKPLKALAGVAEKVKQTGDYTTRAHWKSTDEIGQLCESFNSMLTQLDLDRIQQQELAASARAARAQAELIESFPIPMVVTSVPNHEVLHINKPAEPWLGNCRNDPWRTGLEPGVRIRFFQRLADNGSVDEFEVRWLHGPEPLWAVLSARQFNYQGHKALLTAFTPITMLKIMEKRLELWAKVFEASSEGIVIMNPDFKIISANKAFCRSTGYEYYEILGEEFPHLMDGVAPQWNLTNEKDTWQGEVSFRRQSGSTYPAWLMVSTVREGGDNTQLSYICIVIDITDRKAKEERIRFLAQHDVLTELPNRALCQARLSEALASAQRSGEQVAVLFIDLDRFKIINDTLGHHIGDGLLRTIAQRLVNVVRTDDTVSRQGGDEFVVIMRNISGRKELDALIEQRLIPSIRQSMIVDEHQLSVSCSVGAAIYPHDAQDQDELMRCADAAMYEAKAAGRDTSRHYSIETGQRVLTRQTMETHLRCALENNEFSLHYQPRLCAKTRNLLGAEALLRWKNPELGMVPPGEFIRLAEETGLIKTIGPWVLLQASKEWMGLVEKLKIGPLNLSVNLSAAQLADHQLIDQVNLAIQQSGLPAECLELELTESHLMENPSFAQKQVSALKALGVQVSIDDFGTGYSSLAYLKRFEIDKLKVDQSFVHNMLGDAADAAIVQAVIGLGHTLKLKVVAEGVENMPTAQALTALHCDELQGYGFGRPMPGTSFLEWALFHISDVNRRKETEI
jgi:diguanylate cyclase (GGDEF)-like protein/PAS domain S-box-containing protein